MKNIQFVAEIIQTQGVLLRAGLVLERRGFVLEALETIESEGRVFLSIKVKGEEEKKEQAIKQLSKLIDVISIQETKNLELETLIKELQPFSMLA